MKVSKRIINLETESAFAILAKATKLMSEGKDIINLGGKRCNKSWDWTARFSYTNKYSRSCN